MSPEPSRNISRLVRKRPQRSESFPFHTTSVKRVTASSAIKRARRRARTRREFGFVSTAGTVPGICQVTPEEAAKIGNESRARLVLDLDLRAKVKDHHHSVYHLR